jgi:hypothetical protein
MIKISETLLSLLTNDTCYNVTKMKFRNAGYAEKLLEHFRNFRLVTRFWKAPENSRIFDIFPLTFDL